MTYQQVRDVVTRIQNAHHQMREVLEEAQSPSGDPRTERMLTHLSQEEQNLRLALAKYGAEGQQPLLDTWLQYIPDEQVWEALDTIEFAPDMQPDEIVNRKLEFDQQLIALLRQLAEQTAIPRVQEFFNTLLADAESRTAQQVWSVREYQAAAKAPRPDK